MAINPCEPRSAPLENLDGRELSKVQRSRWALFRLLPVAYFGTVAVMAPIGAVFMAVVLVVSIWRSESHDVSYRLPAHWALLAMLGYSLVGLVASLIARFWYLCQWKRAIFSTIGVYMVGVLAAFLLQGR